MDNREGTVDLLSQKQTGHIMRKRHAGEAEKQVGPVANARGQTSGPAHHKRQGPRIIVALSL